MNNSTENSLKKNVLSAALMSSTVLAHGASAQDLEDDRWHVTGTVGFNVQDSQRGTDNAPLIGIGLGKSISPTWSLDAELNYQNPQLKEDRDKKWSQRGVSLDLRRHFISEGRQWNPYLLFGVGTQKVEEETLSSSDKRSDSSKSAKVGLGLQSKPAHRRSAVRAEVAYRRDFDDKSSKSRTAGGNKDAFGDVLASVSLMLPLGAPPSTSPATYVRPAPQPAEETLSPSPPPQLAVSTPPVAPKVPSCAELDDDGDGVNNCDDRCPNSSPDQLIGPDGCPTQRAVDFRGVHFDFNRDILNAEAVAVLDEAAEILKRYPGLQVEVVGHTDAIGSNAVNQRLSERRARTVYNYLVNKGIDRSRLVGPTGYGKTQPIAPNDTRDGRAQNRRTELIISSVSPPSGQGVAGTTL